MSRMSMREGFNTFVLGLLVAGSIVTTGSSRAAACPRVERLPDFNCDGKASIVVLGDSLVSGVGDTKFHGRGGYVLRTQQAFKTAKIRNLGKPGETTLRLILSLKQAFNVRRSQAAASGSRSALASALWDADLVVLDLGRNDAWMNKPASATQRNLKRIRSLIEEGTTSAHHPSPMVVTALLMLPKRPWQAPWVRELNQLLARSNKKQAPSDLHFDWVSTKYLHSDRLHPTSRGYESMAAIFTDYLKRRYPAHARALRPDKDHDGLYDLFEEDRFGTSPKFQDTDHDGIVDGKDDAPLS